MNPHEANRAFWDASTHWWKAKEDARGLWRRAHVEPSLVLSTSELPYVRDVAGKDACVLGSGDNEVVFALAGLGALVTSVDISQARLDVAAERARELGLDVSFVRADVTDLSAIESNMFHLVYTGGHVCGWVSDIAKYYAEAVRIVRRGGLFVVNEYHPIRRMWLDAKDLTPHYRYFDRGPHAYTSDEGQPTFEYHWTVADHIQAIIDGGCRIVKVDEHGEGADDAEWMGVRLNKFPMYLMIVGRKDAMEGK